MCWFNFDSSGQNSGKMLATIVCFRFLSFGSSWSEASLWQASFSAGKRKVKCVMERNRGSSHRRERDEVHDVHRDRERPGYIPTLIPRREVHLNVERAPEEHLSENARLRFNNDRLLEDNLRLTTENHCLSEQNSEMKSENEKLHRFMQDQKKVNSDLKADIQKALQQSKEASETAAVAMAKVNMCKKENASEFDFYSQVLIDCQVCITSLGGKPAFPLRHVEPWKTACSEANYEKNHATWQRMKNDAAARFLDRNWKESESPRRRKRSRSAKKRDRRK